MSGSKSKQKGKGWERDVCLFLSELYNQSFIRVPGSGAFIGGSNQFRKETLSDEQIKLSRGDIIPPEHYPYFLAECKNYADFPFHQLILRNDIALLDSWIDQVEHDMTSEKDVWLLFVKVTRKGQYVLFDTNIFVDYIGSVCNICFARYATYNNATKCCNSSFCALWIFNSFNSSWAICCSNDRKR